MPDEAVGACSRSAPAGTIKPVPRSSDAAARRATVSDPDVALLSSPTSRRAGRERATIASALAAAPASLCLCHGCGRAESPARTTALASGDRQRRPVSRGGATYLRSSRSERRRERVRRRSSGPAVRGVASRKRARRRSPVTGSGCGSTRAVLSPSSAQGVGDRCGDSRGVPALPTSPSEGLRPIRRRPSGPSSGVDAGPVGGLAQSRNTSFGSRNLQERDGSRDRRLRASGLIAPRRSPVRVRLASSGSCWKAAASAAQLTVFSPRLTALGQVLVKLPT